MSFNESGFPSGGAFEQSGSRSPEYKVPPRLLVTRAIDALRAAQAQEGAVSKRQIIDVRLETRLLPDIEESMKDLDAEGDPEFRALVREAVSKLENLPKRSPEHTELLERLLKMQEDFETDEEV